MEDVDSRDTAVVFLGKDASEETAEQAEEWITEACPMLEVSFLETRQPVYELMIGIV